MAKKKSDDSLSAILAQYSQEKEYSFVSTGSIILDAILGGGISPGSMYALWGPQGSGKSTIAFQIAKRFCKNGDKVAFIDVERAFNRNQQVAFGLREFVESGLLTVLTVDDYEDCYKVCKALAQSEEYKLVIVDSETELGVAAPDDIDVTSLQPGQKSRQSAQVLSALKKLFAANDVASIWLCHARANIDMSAGPYAPKEKQAGGYGVKHTPDVILKISAGQKIKDGDKILGQVLHVVADKNKFQKPFQQFDVQLYFGKGIIKKNEVIQVAIDQGIIEQSGAYYKLPNGETVRGTSALYELSNSDLKAIMDSLKPLISD